MKIYAALFYLFLMDNTPATMINSQVRPHSLLIYKQYGFILMMPVLGTKGITQRMDPTDYYNG
jgi:hypothetical protein